MSAFRKIAYAYRLCAKVFSYFSFGVCSLLFSSVGFPILYVASGFSQKRFQRLARKIVHRYFKIFLWEMRLMGVLAWRTENLSQFKIFPGVVVANHPSFLDVVILLAIIPNANCIVKGSLAKTPFVRSFVKALYIPNDMPFEKELELAAQSIREGSPLIIFPEGTRTVPDKPMRFKKGAARFALYAQSDILPIYIGGNEKIGLRKNDPFFSAHPTERYRYRIKALRPIPIRKFAGFSPSAAVIHITEELQETLENERDRERGETAA